MHSWSAHDAEAQFSELLDACINEGPQMITRCGSETAVLVSIEIWRQLQAASKPSLKELLLTDTHRAECVGQVRRSRNLTSAPRLDDPADTSVEKAWNQEIEQRIAEIDSGQENLLSRDEFRKKMQARIGNP